MHLTFVNRTMYQNQLKVGITLQKVGETNVYRNKSFQEEKINVTGTDTKEAVKQNKISFQLVKSLLVHSP